MGKDAKYVVRLEPQERDRLQSMVDEGRGSKSVRQRARVLLKADQAEGAPAWTDERVAEFAEVSLSCVHRVRQRFVEEGLDAVLSRRPSPQRQYRKLDGAGEARLIATACSRAPEGRSRWTLELLAEKLVELKVVESISVESVRRTLKKTSFSPTARSNG
jgi:transposase